MVKHRNKKYGRALKLLRRRAAMKQDTMAAELEMSQGAYSRLESHGAGFDVDRLEGAARALAIEPREILDTANAIAKRP